MNALERRLFNLEQSRRPGTYPALVVGGETVFNGDRGAGCFTVAPVGGGDQLQQSYKSDRRIGG